MVYKTCKNGHIKTPENTVNRSCKICKNEATIKWRESHQLEIKEYVERTKEKKLKQNSEWYFANKEHCCKRKKRWKIKNSEKIAISDKLYRELNKEKEIERKRIWHLENENHRLKYRAENAERIAKNKKQWKKRNKDKVLDSHHRRRAAKKNVNSERVSLKTVYARDGWLCKICGEPVNFIRQHPDPMSPSLDHIIPLSKGGPHTFANVQLAHLICNLRKTNKLTTAVS